MEAKELLDSLDVGVLAMAPDWTIAEWSAAAARITALPADRVLGQSIWIAFPAAKGTELERVFGDVLADGRPRTFLAPAGAPEAPGTVLETRVTRGAADHLAVAFRPVHEELAPESRAAQLLSALEAERRLYLQLFSSLPTPALVLTPDGQILDTNSEGAKLLGGRDAAALRGRALAGWAPAAQQGMLAAALRHAVTRRQDVAHELNNPLAAIAAFGEALALDPHQADLEESAEVIRSEAMRAGRIVQTLLDFARQRPRIQTAVDLGEIAERVLALQRSALKKARIRTTVSVPNDVPAVAGDPQELQQVMLNAVVNARQAIEGTGRPGQITIAGRLSDHHVLVTVDGTGPGVPPGILDRVFEPFFSTKPEHGTGLGLAISFGLVRGMGGRMWMQNVEGGGARLRVELPVDAGSPDATARATGRPAAQRLSLLVVEDEEAVRRAMALLAKRLGHEVTTVGRFAEATARLAQPGARYDALLVDVHLDEAHTGFDLFDHLRTEGRGLEQRIVFTTGDSISTQTRDALERADRPVLRKPFSLDDLREMLERVAAG